MYKLRFVTLSLLSILTLGKFVYSQNNLLILADTVYIYSDRDFELLLAANEGDTVKLKAFLELGANPNYSTYDGITPLMYASQVGHLRTVEILIDSGANVNALPNNHYSALLGASIAGHIYVVDTLILNGADINTYNLEGITPLMAAATFNYTVIADLLLFYRADISKKDIYGNTALHYSTFYNNLEISLLLSNNGLDIDSTDNKGNSPLMIAAQNGHISHIEMLIQQGADIRLINDNDLNALSFALLNRNYEAIDFLIMAGSDVHYQVAKNINQLTIAREYGDKITRQILKENGAISNRKLRVNKFSIGLDLNGNSDDFMLGGNLSFIESNFGFTIEAGYKTRPGVRSVICQSSDPNVLYQLWEKRSCMHLGIEKLIKLYRTSFKNDGGFYAGINGTYTYGNFRGSNKKPDDKILLVPKAGFYLNFDQLSLKIHYEYMQFQDTKVSPHRINLSIGYTLNISKNKIDLKQMPTF